MAINSKDNRNPRRIPYLRYVGEDTYQVGRRNATEALNAFKKITGRAPKKSAYLAVSYTHLTLPTIYSV